MTPTHTAQKLREAADLIEPEGAWTQGAFARTKRGAITHAASSNAVCWCLEGALNRVGAPDGAYEALDSVVYELDALCFNDSPDTTQEMCVTALRAAADAALDL